MEPETVEAGPPALIEAVVRVLTPPACREHVLGDLWERYRSPSQYLSDAMRTVPFVLASQIRRTVSAPLLAFQAISVFVTFAGPSLTPVRSAVAATLAAVAILAVRQAYRLEAPQWPKGPAMDALAAASGAVLFSILLQIAMPRRDVAPVAALDSGAGALLLVFFANVLWASRVSGRGEEPFRYTRSFVDRRSVIAG